MRPTIDHRFPQLLHLPVCWCASWSFVKGCVLLSLLLCATPSIADDPIDFNRDIRPLLSDKCFHCHGPDRVQREAGLRLDVESSAHSQAIVPGDPDSSEMVVRILSNDPDRKMPPTESGKSLTDDEIKLLSKWVRSGAKYDEHWSFVAPRQVDLPNSKFHGWDANPIDAFVAKRLEAAGLTPSPRADKATLLRRVTLDLTGLPPTTSEVDTFLNDETDSAYETVVDRLLASERYGERMAQQWLDAARYADTMGYQADWERYQWRWRTWVIDAYNRNLPFDEFTVEQLAGDLLPNATTEQLIATGFNRNHRINDEGGIIPAEYLVEYIVDRVETVSATWMGLTIGCARCHDHKFDPISQADFYQLFAFFNAVPEKGKQGRKGYADPYVRVAVRGKQTAYERKKKRVATCSSVDGCSAEELAAAKAELESFEEQFTTYVMVMREMETPRATHILKRGVYDQPGDVVTADVPARLLGALPADAPRNRLGLARWLVSGKHPLTARVVVNRYWEMLFGRGIVNTPEDMGLQGDYPSHPKLLDWLASEYPRIGWDTKAILRLMVTSQTYQQSSRRQPTTTTNHRGNHDPNNVLIGRMSRLRLPAEMIRDQALSASGLLVHKIGGPSVKPYQPDGLWRELSFQDKKRSTDFYEPDTGDALYRRSLYTFWKRSVPPPAMATFDAPSREICVMRRSRTNTPLQALALMNDVTYIEASRALAEKSMHAHGDDPSAQIAYAFKALLARGPTIFEWQTLKRGYEKRLRQFQNEPDAARQLVSVGETQRDPSLDVERLAALTTSVSNIMNLDETINRE